MAVTTTSLSVLDSTGTTKTLATQTDPAGIQRSVVSVDAAGAAIYRAAASFTPQATAAVTLLSIQGAVGKTIRVRRIYCTGHSTANGQTWLALQRTSALGAGGTTVTPGPAKMDSGTVASPTAVISHYTTTLKAAGTPVGGPLSVQDFWTGVVTTPTVGTPGVSVFPEGGAPIGQSIVLRGVADFLEVQNANAGNLSAGTVLTYVVEWEEDGS